jgi:hypothetical protein
MNPPPTTPENMPRVPNADLDKRARTDRRQKPTSPWDVFRLRGRRSHARRTEEHLRPYFVERFSPILLTLGLMLLMATLLDGVLTLHLMTAGAEELNPLMDRLLSIDMKAFLLGKYVLTAVGLLFFVFFKNFYFGKRIRIGHFIPIVIALYVVLIVYQIVLMWEHIL